MRAKLIAACALLAVILALCWYAAATVTANAELMRNLATRAIAAVEVDDYARAEALLGELFKTIDERRPVLEVLALHEDINDVSAQAIDARVRLRFEQREEFLCAMAQLLESLTLLNERQALTWGNLF